VTGSFVHTFMGLVFLLLNLHCFEYCAIFTTIDISTNKKGGIQMDATRRQITKIARAATKYATRALKKSGVGTTEYECLQVIRKNKGINQEQISEMLNIDKAAVTRMIHNLEKKGYAVREKDMRDKRNNRIYATKKALDVKFDESSAECLFYEWLMEDIAPDDTVVFLRVLNQLAEKAKDEYNQNFSNVKAQKS